MAAENKTPTRTEREAGMKRGYLSQVKVGKIRIPGPEVIRDLADYLRVSYEWLAIGRGPMRTDGWAPTPLEEAMLFARKAGARADAIEAAIAERRDDPELVTAWDWALAFDDEARKLERKGVPRPEKVEREQKRWKRRANKIRRAKVEAAEVSTERRQRRGGAA